MKVESLSETVKQHHQQVALTANIAASASAFQDDPAKTQNASSDISSLTEWIGSLAPELAAAILVRDEGMMDVPQLFEVVDTLKTLDLCHPEGDDEEPCLVAEEKRRCCHEQRRGSSHCSG